MDDIEANKKKHLPYLNGKESKTVAFLKRWLIRLQRIYNFLLLHAILSTVLDIIGLNYTRYIIFGTNLLT